MVDEGKVLTEEQRPVPTHEERIAVACERIAVALEDVASSLKTEAKGGGFHTVASLLDYLTDNLAQIGGGS